MIVAVFLRGINTGGMALKMADFKSASAMHAAIPFQPGERLEDGGDWFRWTIARGDTLGEFGGKVLGRRTFRDRLTSRNYRTIQKVQAEMQRLAH